MANILDSEARAAIRNREHDKAPTRQIDSEASVLVLTRNGLALVLLSTISKFGWVEK